MAVRKPADALKAKQRKQKIFVAIGGVALLAAGAFEFPMIMKLTGSGGGEPPPPAQTTAAPSAPGGMPTSLAPPTPGTAGATPVAGVGKLVDSDVPPQPSQSRLVGFNLFPSKDPFVQQVSPVSQTADSASDSGSSSGGASAGSGSDAASKADKPAADVPAGDSVVPASSAGSASSGGSSSGSGTATTVPTVTISVNAKEEAVGKGGTFPRGAPTFRLVSFAKGTAEIGIVGGSYASGGETVTLKQGEPLTLVNTTDDTRYRIVLVRTP